MTTNAATPSAPRASLHCWHCRKATAQPDKGLRARIAQREGRALTTTILLPTAYTPRAKGARSHAWGRGRGKLTWMWTISRIVAGGGVEEEARGRAQLSWFGRRKTLREKARVCVWR